jgi:hypothetical protein
MNVRLIAITKPAIPRHAEGAPRDRRDVPGGVARAVSGVGGGAVMEWHPIGTAPLGGPLDVVSVYFWKKNSLRFTFAT